MKTIFDGEREAKIQYFSGDYKIITPGRYVTCAVTGQKIDLVNLRYWCAVRQEAYLNSEIATRRHYEAGDPQS